MDIHTLIYKEGFREGNHEEHKTYGSYPIIVTQIKLIMEGGKTKKVIIDSLNDDILEDLTDKYLGINAVFENGKKIYFYGKLLNEKTQLKNGIVRISAIHEEPNNKIDSDGTSNISEIIDLTNFVFEDSIKWGNNFEACNFSVNIQAEWLQQIDGLFCIEPNLDGIVGSLNCNFCEPDCKIKKTGYTLVSSTLKKTRPTNLHSPENFEFPCKNGNLALNVNWFKIDFTVAWDYEQKRIENAKFKINFIDEDQLNSEIFTNKDNEINLKIECIESIEGFSPKASNFFDTKIGEESLQNTIGELKKIFSEKFKVKIYFEMQIEEALNLQIGQFIKIHNTQIKIDASIYKINYIFDGVKRYAEIYCFTQPEWFKNWHSKAYKLEQTRADKTLGVNGIQDVIQERNVLIENDFNEQIKKISELTKPSESDVTRLLERNPTKVKIELKDLQTKKCLSREIEFIFLKEEEI